MFPFDESIPSRPARIRRLLDQLLAWVAVFSAMVKIAAAELTISDIRVQPNQPVQIRVPAAHDSYYLLFRGEQVQQIVLPRDARLSEGPEVTLTDPVPRPDTAFYRVEQIPVATPRDTDGDGMDDVFELKHSAACNPLVADGDQDPDHDGKSNLEEYVLGTDPATANVPPVVRLVAPNDLAVLFLPGPFDLIAEASDADGQLSSVEMLVGETVLVSLTNAPFTFSWTNAPVGTNRLTARATDQFGARATSGPVTVRVRFPNQLPNVAITAPETNSLHALPVAIEVMVAASDSEGPVESVRIFFNRTNLLATFEKAPFAFGWTNAPLGTNELTAVALDSDGASVTSAPVSIRVIVANRAPEFAAIPDQAVDEENPLSLSLSATDADEPPQPLAYSLVSGPAGLSVTSGALVTWTPAEAQGPSTNLVTVSVTDGSLTTTNSFSVVVREVNVPPTFAGATNATINELVAYTQSLVPQDADVPAQSLTVALVSGPTGLVVTNGVLAWTPTEAQGPSTNAVQVTVTDGVGTTTNSFSVVVREVNALPTLAGATNATINELVAYTQDLVPQDADVPAQSVTVALVSGPTGLVVTNGVLAWTPTEAQGPSTNLVTVSVTDGLLTTTNGLTVTVREVNVPPVLAAIPDQVLGELTSLNLRLVAVDVDEPPQTLAFGLISGPEGLTVSPDGVVTWTPSEVQGPTNAAVLVSVTDGVILTSRPFRIEVREVNTGPTWASVPDWSLPAADLLAVVLRPADADLPPQALSVALQTGPSGLELRDRTFLWQPTSDQIPGIHTAEVSVTDGDLSAAQILTFTLHGREPAPPLREAYHRLEFSPDQSAWTVVAVGLTADSLTNAIPGGRVGFFRSQRVSLFAPKDSDGDGMDDRYELEHPERLDPMDPADARETGPDGQPNIAVYLRSLFGSPTLPPQFISREVTVFNFGQPTATVESVSREVSVFNALPGSGAPLTEFSQAISREVTVFNFGSPAATVEAISRELSVFNFGAPPHGTEAIGREVTVYNAEPGSAAPFADFPSVVSREVTVFNFGQPSAAIEAISREVTVLNFQEP